MQTNEPLCIKLLRQGAVVPKRATDGSAGYDLYACLAQPERIRPGETKKIPTGIAMALPLGVVGLICARSSMAVTYGILPANAVGVIDSDYRGEVLVALYNQSGQPYQICHGDRIAQLLLVPYFTPSVELCEHLDDTQRGTGGFGSTGKS